MGGLYAIPTLLTGWTHCLSLWSHDGFNVELNGYLRPANKRFVDQVGQLTVGLLELPDVSLDLA